MRISLRMLLRSCYPYDSRAKASFDDILCVTQQRAYYVLATEEYFHFLKRFVLVISESNNTNGISSKKYR